MHTHPACPCICRTVMRIVQRAIDRQIDGVHGKITPLRIFGKIGAERYVCMPAIARNITP